MARILVRGSEYAREELHQEEKPYILKIRNKLEPDKLRRKEKPFIFALCLIDNDTREAKHAFEFVGGPLRRISPWASIYEVNPMEQQMRDLVRTALEKFSFRVADNIIASMAEITRREAVAKREEERKDKQDAQIKAKEAQTV
jgi:hypothetical protein